MANLKISQLPSTTTTTLDDYFVKNNSGETTTNKVKVRDTLGLTKGTANDSIKSASFLSSTPATSTGIGSVAIGNNSEANADGATALGQQAEVFDSIRVNGTAIGVNTRVAQYSTAVGNDTIAVGAGCVAIGKQSTAVGGSDIAIGDNAYSQVQYGVCIGYSSEITTGSGGVAVGGNSSTQATNAVSLGQDATASANNAVAIGYLSTASHQNSVVLGANQSSLYTDTTHMKNGYVADNLFFQEVAYGNLSAFTVNLSLSTLYQITLNQDATLTFTNPRSGGVYWIIMNNTGTFNFTSVTAAGYTIRYTGSGGGGRANLTHNSYDMWKITVYGTGIFVEQVQNFTT